jgi:DNA polymerase
VDDGETRIWIPGEPIPPEFIEAANNPDYLVVAHNDAFERLIEHHILGPRYGWPIMPIERHRCTMAMALAMALPAALGKVGHALGLEQRKADSGLMKRMARPRKPRRDEDPNGIYWFDDPERLVQLYDYCKQDAETERELYFRLKPLIASEHELWMLDARINERGFYVDRDLAQAMVKIADAARAEIDAELASITDGAVTSTNQTNRLTAWLTEHGCPVDDIRKGTLSHALRRKNLAPEVYRVLELRRAGAHAAAAKPQAFLDRCSDDGRVRGAFTYHGASTGRWSSLGIQVQNLKRVDGVDDVAGKIEAITAGDIELVRKHGQLLETIGSVVRALIRAAPGHHFIAGDFSGIESRVLAWVSRQQSKLNQWAAFDRTRKPEDEPYVQLGRMPGVPEEQSRIVGKTADLAFGYQGGLGAWRAMAKLYLPDDASTDEQIRQRQQAWRNAHPQTVRFWGGLNRAAIQATRKPGTTVQVDRLSFHHDGAFLFLKLPSGRSLAYPFAKLMTTDRGDLAVTFMDNQAGKWVECRFGHGAYGGLWAENVVSAIARDLLAAAIQRLEAAGYPVVLHVHDEIVAEVPDEFGSVEEFEKIITALPPWAGGLPVTAKVRNGPRFCKTSTAETTNPEPPPGAPGAGAPGEEITDNPSAEEAPRLNGNGYDSRGSGHSPHNERRSGRTLATYVYEDAGGRPHLRVFRKENHQFPQQFMVEGGWVWKKPNSWVNLPYRLPELIKALPDAPVFVCEGEKDANSCAELGLVSTCNPEGAGKFGPELLPWFVGKRVAYVCEDNDERGRAHALKVAALLSSVVSDVRIVTFRDLPEHGDVSDWLDQGHTKTELLERARTAPKAEAKPKADFRVHWLDDVDEPELPWLVHGLITETGCGLISGQWGAYKTSGALDLSAAVIAGESFIDYAVRRRGGVLYIAVEGSAGIKNRFRAILDEKYPGAGVVPFALVKSCPRLLDKNAGDTLARIAEEAARRMRDDFGVPLALITVDTIAKAAGYAKPGDENDAAVGTIIMDRLADLSQRSGAFVFGVDHFGKMVETGTRGTSAKESAADTILALLGAKDIAGAMSNTRLAVRKVREGETGREIAFTVRVKDLGRDRFGQPQTAPVVLWKTAGATSATRAGAEGWPKSLHQLRRALMVTLAGSKARQANPMPGEPPVQAIDYETLREEFAAIYPADGTARAKVIGQAFKRAVERAQEQELIGVRNVEGVTLIWMNPV